MTITKCLYFRDFKLQDTYENDKNFIESLEMYQELKTECGRIRGVLRDPEVVARKWLNITFKDKKITDLDKNDWKQFRKIVEDSINLYRG